MNLSLKNWGFSLLPSEIRTYIFTLTKLRLRDIINLTMVSKKLRQMALSEENWYIISDTQQLLYNFIRVVKLLFGMTNTNTNQHMFMILQIPIQIKIEKKKYIKGSIQ